jgi:hypothetical protein
MAKTKIGGSILGVQAKTVNKQTVMEIKLRMPFKSEAFEQLGELVQQPVHCAFEPSQQDAFEENDEE